MLKPGNDFVITCLDFHYRDLDDFVERIFDKYEENRQMRIKIVVYNFEDEELRVSVVQPNREWDGEGLLGVEFGAGMVNDFRALQAQKALRIATSQKILNQPKYEGYETKMEDDFDGEIESIQEDETQEDTLNKNDEVIEKEVHLEDVTTPNHKYTTY